MWWWKQRSERFEDAVLLALKMEDGSMSQRMRAVSRSWKRQRKVISPRAYRRSIANWHPNFSLSGSQISSDLQNCKIIHLCYFATKFMVTCVSSRKLILVLLYYYSLFFSCWTFGLFSVFGIYGQWQWTLWTCSLVHIREECFYDIYIGESC